MFRLLKRLLVGKPIDTKQEEGTLLNVPLGIAVFAADALSSTAYATDEILIALAASPLAAAGNALSIPVALAIATLIILVVISYRQVIKAYPGGGGAYIVARENLGIFPSLLAAASLLIDYILTVSVSVSAGVAAITSTGLIAHEHTVTCALIFTTLIMLVNLRGVKESGQVFAVPAFTFVVSMFGMIVFGFWQYSHAGASGGMAPVTDHGSALNSLVLNATVVFFFLKAFSHGCVGLTGIEAVSNGVKAFKEPAPQRANSTMTIMGVILCLIFLGVTYLAYALHINPSQTETVVSQIARTVFGAGSIMYYLIQFSTMVLLILAANTAFAGFPKIASLLAKDGYLPRQLMNLGDRLVFSNGIFVLGALSMFLIYIFGGVTTALIPLYAVGVFMSFTLTQAGMVRHHLREREAHWLLGTLINGFGGVVTAIVTVILAVEKFTEGAWIIFIAVPVLILMFNTISTHYRCFVNQLALPENPSAPAMLQDHCALVLVSSLNRGTLKALEYARALSTNVEAVNVELSVASSKQLQSVWAAWGQGVPLKILPSPYRSISGPIIDYLDEIEREYPKRLVTLVVPEFVTKKAWHNLLHNQTSIFLKTILRFRKGKVVTTVRYYLEQ